MHPVSDPLMYRYGWPATHKPSVKSLHACTPRLWIPTSFIPRPALPFHRPPLHGEPFPLCPTLLRCTTRVPPHDHDATEFIHVYGPWQKWYRNTRVRIIYYNNSRTPIRRRWRHTHTLTRTHVLSIDIIRGNHLAGRGLITDKRPSAKSVVSNKHRNIVSAVRLPSIYLPDNTAQGVIIFAPAIRSSPATW